MCVVLFYWTFVFNFVYCAKENNMWLKTVADISGINIQLVWKSRSPSKQSVLHLNPTLIQGLNRRSAVSHHDMRTQVCLGNPSSICSSTHSPTFHPVSIALLMLRRKVRTPVELAFRKPLRHHQVSTKQIR